MRKVSVKVNDELAAHLDERAAESGQSTGDYLAGLIEEDARRTQSRREVERHVYENAEEMADALETQNERQRASEG